MKPIALDYIHISSLKMRFLAQVGLFNKVINPDAKPEDITSVEFKDYSEEEKWEMQLLISRRLDLQSVIDHHQTLSSTTSEKIQIQLIEFGGENGLDGYHVHFTQADKPQIETLLTQIFTNPSYTQLALNVLRSKILPELELELKQEQEDSSKITTIKEQLNSAENLDKLSDFVKADYSTYSPSFQKWIATIATLLNQLQAFLTPPPAPKPKLTQTEWQELLPKQDSKSVLHLAKGIVASGAANPYHAMHAKVLLDIAFDVIEKIKPKNEFTVFMMVDQKDYLINYKAFDKSYASRPLLDDQPRLNIVKSFLEAALQQRQKLSETKLPQVKIVVAHTRDPKFVGKELAQNNKKSFNDWHQVIPALRKIIPDLMYISNKEYETYLKHYASSLSLPILMTLTARPDKSGTTLGTAEGAISSTKIMEGKLTSEQLAILDTIVPLEQQLNIYKSSASNKSHFLNSDKQKALENWQSSLKKFESAIIEYRKPSSTTSTTTTSVSTTTNPVSFFSTASSTTASISTTTTPTTSP